MKLLCQKIWGLKSGAIRKPDSVLVVIYLRLVFFTLAEANWEQNH